MRWALMILLLYLISSNQSRRPGRDANGYRRNETVGLGQEDDMGGMRQRHFLLQQPQKMNQEPDMEEENAPVIRLKPLGQSREDK